MAQQRMGRAVMKKDNKLPEEVMILDLMGQTASQALRKPFKYVAGVYQNMGVHGWQTPGLRVRIEREGTGAQPYYRIERDEPDGSEKILGFCHGEGHTCLDDTFKIQNGRTWSSRTMTFKEVQNLHDTMKAAGKS